MSVEPPDEPIVTDVETLVEAFVNRNNLLISQLTPHIEHGSRYVISGCKRILDDFQNGLYEDLRDLGVKFQRRTQVLDQVASEIISEYGNNKFVNLSEGGRKVYSIALAKKIGAKVLSVDDRITPQSMKSLCEHFGVDMVSIESTA